MFTTMSSQMYAPGQSPGHAGSVRVGEAAAALRDLRLRLGRALRPGRSAQSSRVLYSVSHLAGER